MEGDGLFGTGDMIGGGADKKPTKIGLFDNDEDNEEVEKLQKESILKRGGAQPSKSKLKDDDEEFKPQEFKPSRALPDKKKKTVLDMLGESDDDADGGFKPD